MSSRSFVNFSCAPTCLGVGAGDIITLWVERNPPHPTPHTRTLDPGPTFPLSKRGRPLCACVHCWVLASLMCQNMYHSQKHSHATGLTCISTASCSFIHSIKVTVTHAAVFCSQETREKVKLLLQLADSLVEKGHAHAASIKSWVASVDKRYKDFSSRMEKYRVKLETTLGLSVDVSPFRSS